jgi:hypothetical protein
MKYMRNHSPRCKGTGEVEHDMEDFWRKKDKSQPYCAAFLEEIVDLNLKFHKKLVSASDYNVRLIYGRVNVKEDPESYIDGDNDDDDDRVYFSLSEIPLYGQPWSSASLVRENSVVYPTSGSHPPRHGSTVP